MIRVETLVIDIDRLHKFFQVVALVDSPSKLFLAVGAAGLVDEPLFDAFAVENVVAVEHSAHRLVLHWLETDSALAGEKLTRFDPNQDLLYVEVFHLLVPLLKQCLSLLFASILSLDPRELPPLLLSLVVGAPRVPTPSVIFKRVFITIR